jgi:hypothetical protein
MPILDGGLVEDRKRRLFSRRRRFGKRFASSFSDPGFWFFRNPFREIRSIYRHRKRHRHGMRQYFAAFSRFREKNLNSDLFLNRNTEPKLKAGTVLGKSKQIVNGVLDASLGGNTTLGSDLKASLHVVRTWDQLHPGPPYRGGGPFRSIVYHLPESRKVGYGRFTNQGRSAATPNTYGVYTGSFVDNGVWLGDSYETIKAKGFSNFPSLSAYHSQAWDKCKPVIPKASLGQFLYELRDLPGMLETSANAFHREWKVLGEADRFNPLARDVFERGQFGRRRDALQVAIPVMRPNEAADHFLNHNFGWVPFLGDLGKIFDAFNHSVEYIAAIARDNGQWVKRRRVLDESEVISAEALVGVDSATIPSSEMRDSLGFPMCNLMTLGGVTQRGFCHQTTITKKRVWAAGQFKYYRPEFDVPLMSDFEHGSALIDDMNTVRRLMTLYGLNVSPSLIYKLTPWTWMVDWFTGLGDHIQRLDDFVQDGIVSRGLYVMESEEKVTTKTCMLNFYSGPVTLQFQRVLSTKQRELADSPYGFNVPWKDLSLRQWAILGAIGISRSNAGYISRGA